MRFLLLFFFFSFLQSCFGKGLSNEAPNHQLEETRKCTKQDLSTLLLTPGSMDCVKNADSNDISKLCEKCLPVFEAMKKLDCLDDDGENLKEIGEKALSHCKKLIKEPTTEPTPTSKPPTTAPTPTTKSPNSASTMKFNIISWILWLFCMLIFVIS